MEDICSRVSRLTCEQVQSIGANKSGRHWVALMQAFAEADVNGEMLSVHVRSVEALHTFLREEAELNVPKMIARELHRKLLAISSGAVPAPAPAAPVAAVPAADAAAAAAAAVKPASSTTAGSKCGSASASCST